MSKVASKVNRDTTSSRKETLDSLTPLEQKMVLRGLRAGHKPVPHYRHDFDQKHVRFGYFSDPHIGSKYFDWHLWSKMVAHFKNEGIKTVYSPGDIVEGMSGRPGNVYELEAIGFNAQVSLAVRAISMFGKIQVHSILGNHDLFFKDKTNVDASVGELLALKCDNYHHLGDWEADIEIGKNCTMKLFHANDGTAYATSYKLQKLIESLEGGKKPDIILSGHYHKALYMFCRNVHGFECGTICSQTGWMRGKKIAAHKGFGIIDVWIAKKGGVERLTHQFTPAYD